jgi:hypothetical protein
MLAALNEFAATSSMSLSGKFSRDYKVYGA